MPAPWLIARASGLYCRVFVPADLRPHIGQRFLVRSLACRDKDQGRLIAAHYAMAIGELYRQLRRELSMAEPKVSDIIKTILSGGTRDLTLKGLKAPNGTTVEEVVINDANDAKLFKEQFGSVFNPAPAAQPAPVGKFRRLESHGGLASLRLVSYLEYLKTTHTKYQDSSKRCVQMLLDICGDHPPDDYDPDMLDHFESRIKFLPKNPEKNRQHRDRWATMNFKQLANEGEMLGDFPLIEPPTVNEHLMKLAAFFSFCYDRRYMGEPSPLLKRVKPEGIAKNQPRRFPFDEADLVQIFALDVYESRKLPHTFWPPMIALFTGARCNEIAQLYMDDIVNDDPNHPERWRFQIRIGRGRTDQRLKNKFANRSIPIHPRLIELGFLDYLADVRAEGFDRVFPSLRWTEAAGYGDTVSDMFSTFLRQKVKITERRKVFHSFRHYFCDQANSLTKHEFARIFDITGHLREGEFHLTYAREMFYEAKMEILMAIPLPTMNLPKYTPGMFTKALRATKAKKASEASASPDLKTAHNKARTRKAVAKPVVKDFTIKASKPRKPKAPALDGSSGYAKSAK
jgi:integrase